MNIDTRNKSLYTRHIGMEETAYVLKSGDAFEVWLDTPYHDSVQETFTTLDEAVIFIDAMN